MPTAAKLIAAVAFAALGFLAAEVYKTTLPTRTVWGAFTPISAAMGLLCGWFVMGSLVGRGYYSAMGLGVRTAVTMVFWLLVGFSIQEMIVLSTRLRYDGPMEAILGAFALMLQHGQSLLTVPLLATVFAGGLIGGALSEFAGRRWR